MKAIEVIGMLDKLGVIVTTKDGTRYSGFVNPDLCSGQFFTFEEVAGYKHKIIFNIKDIKSIHEQTCDELC